MRISCFKRNVHFFRSSPSSLPRYRFFRRSRAVLSSFTVFASPMSPIM